MCLSYPETLSHPPSIERLSSVKPVPGAKKVGTAALEYARPCRSFGVRRQACIHRGVKHPSATVVT